jgi:plasmid replication initiation protein
MMELAQRVKKEERSHRDEMNLLEFPIGLVAERVPTDPATGAEFSEIIFERTIEEKEATKIQRWKVKGDRGLPRGYDLDVFTALMTLWSASNFESRLISIGSAYFVLQQSGKSDGGEQYARFRKAIDRLYGVSFSTLNAVYDPMAKQRYGEYEFRFISSYKLKESDEEKAPRGYVRVTDEFYKLVKLGYLKFTDMERYWRLPDTYTRRLFQYLDKHRTRSLREHGGRHEINIYLLARKLGTLDQTLRRYKPAKLREILISKLDALVTDGYLQKYTWRKEGKGPAAVVLVVHYAADEPATDAVALSERETYAVEQLGQILREPHNRIMHARIVRELGADRTLNLLGKVTCQEARNPAAYFSSLVELERKRLAYS